MVRALLAAGWLMLLVPSIQAGDDNPAAQIKARIAEYEQANADFMKALRAAKTIEDRKEAISKRPLPEVYAKKLLPLAESAPKEAAGEALAWLAGNAGFTPEGKTAFGLLLEHHATNPGIAKSVERLALLTDPRMEKFLDKVMAENSSEEAKGQAAYGLAKRHLSAADRGGRKLKQEQIDELNAKAEKLLMLVKERYAAVKTANSTLGESIKGELFAIQNLTVGKTAPDIAGEDTDGKKFKLSDYRGKVVLLDFWGHW